MQENEVISVKEVEIAHLNLKYLHTRIQNKKATVHLSESLERFGQITPIIVVPDNAPIYILIDGYLRVEALKRCRKDIVLAHVWQCSEEEALLHLLARTQDRKWEIFEQAILIQELHIHHHLSANKIATLLGKDKSFVLRRLSLLEILDDEMREHVQKGDISVWSASRVLVPMARATPEHAKELTRNLVKHPMSSRDLVTFFKHYQKSNKKTREEMIHSPGLFLKALQTKQEEKSTTVLRKGPEGKWLKDVQIIGHMLRRLLKDVSVVFYMSQSNLDRRLLLTAFEETEELFLSLTKQIRRIDDTIQNRRDHFGAAQKRSPDTQNQPFSEALEAYGSTGDKGQTQKDASEVLTIP